jgi:ABC-type Fe3+ transport system permease subunit
MYTMLWVGLLSLREVSMALFLQRPQNTVLATQIWNYWMSTKPAEAAALGTMLIVVVAAGFIVLLQVAGRHVYRS